MNTRLIELIYEDNITEVMSILEEEHTLVPLALRYTVRYDRGLLLLSLLKVAKEKEYVPTNSTIESVRLSMTIDILDEAIGKDDTVTMNSMIYMDVLNVYTLLERAVSLSSLKIYRYSLSKIQELNLSIGSETWMSLLNIVIGTSSSLNNSNVIFLDILTHHKDLDMTDVGRLIVCARSSYKLDLISQYRKFMDVNSLLILSMKEKFPSGINSFLYSVDKKNIDEVVEVAVEERHIDVVNALVTSYKGDVTLLTIMAIEKKDKKMYLLLLDHTPISSYSSLCLAMVRSRMYDEMLDIVLDIDDYTLVLKEMVKENEIDMLDIVLDLRPHTIDYLPILYESSRHDRYNKVRNILFSYNTYITPIVEVFDIVLSKRQESLPILKKMRDIDLEPIRTYIQEMGLYDIDRYISFCSRYGNTK